MLFPSRDGTLDFEKAACLLVWIAGLAQAGRSPALIESSPGSLPAIKAEAEKP